MISIANCGGITAPFLFPSTTSPLYAMGNWTIFAFLIVAACMTVYIWHTFGSHGGYRTGDGTLHIVEILDGDMKDGKLEAEDGTKQKKEEDV